MTTKRKFTNKSIWWVEFTTLNFSNNLFFYNKSNNLLSIKTKAKNLYLLSILLKYNLNSYFYCFVDAVVLKKEKSYFTYQVFQTIFQDIKFIILVNDKKLISLSTIYPGNTWVERELRESTGVNYTGLLDTRKLLLNYTYKTDIEYIQYNSLISDLSL